MSTNKNFENMSGAQGVWVFNTPDHPEGVMFKYLRKNSLLIFIGTWHECDGKRYFDWDYTGCFSFKETELDKDNFDIKKAFELAKKRNAKALKVVHL